MLDHDSHDLIDYDRAHHSTGVYDTIHGKLAGGSLHHTLNCRGLRRRFSVLLCFVWKS